jgi:hypothetical protein
MITWLFGDIGAFKDNYRFLDSHILEQRCNDPIRIIPSIELTGSGSRSGPLRPKKLKPSVRKRLLELLREGQPKEIICAEFQVTVSTVNKLLRTEHEVLASRRKRERDQAVALNRSLWCSLRYRFPDENATSLRAREPKTYAWLYRNDRDWLRLEAIHIPSSNRNFVPLKDWEARDDRLCCLIEEAVRAELACDPATISIPKLFELVPKLASSLEKRNRYPRTRRLLNSLRGMVR